MPDDAAVYRINDETALVQTVDFFTPVVDDPYQWGAIAVANAISDIYAMGATPLTGLNLVGWPKDLDMDLLAQVLEGGADKADEAGCAVVGGHTVDDPEPKFGMSVTGVVHPDKIVKLSTARPGMSIILTKPLGMGIIATACKANRIDKALLKRGTTLMATLNRAAAQAMVEVGAAACTDVTGFGLLGHLRGMLNASGCVGQPRGRPRPDPGRRRRPGEGGPGPRRHRAEPRLFRTLCRIRFGHRPDGAESSCSMRRPREGSS